MPRPPLPNHRCLRQLLLEMATLLPRTVSSLPPNPSPRPPTSSLHLTAFMPEPSAPTDLFEITIQHDPQYEGLVNEDALRRLTVSILLAEGVKGPLEVGVVITT